MNVVNEDGKYWYQADALGSIYGLTDGTGALAARTGYDVFGSPMPPPPAGAGGGQPFGFTGREHDLDAGLVYARARYLQPGTGRWTQPDPARFVDGPNMYGYVRASPTQYRDPTGKNTSIIFTVKPENWFVDVDHVAVHIDDGGDGQPVLFDPSGSYHLPEERSRAEHGEADVFIGADASIDAYANYWRGHKEDRSDVEIFTFATTKEQEMDIAVGFGYVAGSMDHLGDSHSGPVCARSASTALRNSAPFRALGVSFFPGSLRSELKKMHPLTEGHLPRLQEKLFGPLNAPEAPRRR